MNGLTKFRGVLSRSDEIAQREVAYSATGIEELQRLQEDAKKGLLSELQIKARLCRSPTDVTLDHWITNDPAMMKIKQKITCLRVYDFCTSPVLITGPTGVGKELLGRALQIANEPYIAINCGGLPEKLIHSLLFGHLRGSFTGANEDRQGMLLKAGKGIIFLDEIGDLPLELQATLLRAIQESEIYRVGDTTPLKINCRFIAATKYNLRDKVASKEFREDLFARLFTHEFHITGLNERPSDIPLIAKDIRVAVGSVDNETKYFTWDTSWGDPETAFNKDPRILADIALYNVRAIQTYIQRMHIYGCY